MQLSLQSHHLAPDWQRVKLEGGTSIFVNMSLELFAVGPVLHLSALYDTLNLLNCRVDK